MSRLGDISYQTIIGIMTAQKGKNINNITFFFIFLNQEPKCLFFRNNGNFDRQTNKIK